VSDGDGRRSRDTMPSTPYARTATLTPPGQQSAAFLAADSSASLPPRRRREEVLPKGPTERDPAGPPRRRTKAWALTPTAGEPARPSPADGTVVSAPLSTTPVLDAVVGQPWPGPPRLDPGVPPGWVWPPERGRELLGRLSDTPLSACRSSPSASGGTTYHADVADWRVTTSTAWSFTGVDDARSSLIELARRKAALGAWLPPGTALALQKGSEESLWLLCITPRLPSVGERLREAERSGDDRALAEALAAFARGCAVALKLAAGPRVVVHVDPNNFVDIGGFVHCLDDEAGAQDRPLDLASSLVRCLEEYGHDVDSVDRLVSEIEEAVATLSPEEARALDLMHLFDAATQDVAANEALARLRQVANRMSSGE
jgi:hypothetical protein